MALRHIAFLNFFGTIFVYPLGVIPSFLCEKYAVQR